jgi:hypothetical protein
MMAKKSSRWWLTEDSTEAVVDATPEHIYELVADLPRMGEWSPECRSVEWDGQSNGPTVGASFVGHNRGGPRGVMRWSRRGRVMVADPGREFSFVTEEGGRESTFWHYRLEPTETGTRVTESYEVKRIPAWARIVDVPTNRARELREGMVHTLARLKAAAEVRDQAERS